MKFILFLSCLLLPLVFPLVDTGDSITCPSTEMWNMTLIYERMVDLCQSVSTTASNPRWMNEARSIMSFMTSYSFTLGDWIMVTFISSIVLRWSAMYRNIMMLCLIQWMASREVSRQLSTTFSPKPV